MAGVRKLDINLFLDEQWWTVQYGLTMVHKSLLHNRDLILIGEAAVGESAQVAYCKLDSLFAAATQPVPNSALDWRWLDCPLKTSNLFSCGYVLFAAAGQQIHAYSSSTRSWVHVATMPVATCEILALHSGEMICVGGLEQPGMKMFFTSSTVVKGPFKCKSQSAIRLRQGSNPLKAPQAAVS